MASSSYYYDMYKHKKEEIRKYEDNLNDLNKISDNLVNDLYDEIRTVNNELDDLTGDLEKAVRHNSAFSRNTSEFGNRKEKSVGLDTYLNLTKESLEDEIARISNLRLQAIHDRDYYYDKYLDKKAEEARERAALSKNKG